MLAASFSQFDPEAEEAQSFLHARYYAQDGWNAEAD
jgi:hypothetical protein